MPDFSIEDSPKPDILILPGGSSGVVSLGRTFHEMKRYAEAIAANQQAAKTAPQRGIALFHLACAYALTGEREKAIAAAAKAVEAGYRLKGSYQNDSDLASIQQDERFKALLAKL